tara:strand:- start:50 stop:367 length:318 start_codon:yes stop_codon:yes gene_type:complete
MSSHDEQYIEKFQPMEEAHHKFGPSALKYIEICPGFRNSNETNPIAEEGTLLHEACETGEVDHLTEEQQGLVAPCLDYVHKLEKDATEAHNEIRLNIHLEKPCTS